ncbi:MAG: methyl-accepting chemotaxis protein [Lentisphaerales bacterium]|nr:methyl-accepting chemotaxis protein [Lentisphaerales bacterium]
MFNRLKLWQKISLCTAVPLFLMGALGVISNNSMGELNNSTYWVNHTNKVIQQAMKIEAAAVDMETGMRGYLLAGKEEFLEPYHGGKQRFHSLLGELKKTVSDNPAQVTLLTETNDNIDEWIANVTEPTIELRREIGHAKTMDDMADEVGMAKGKQFFDKFRGQIALFKQKERALMVKRQQDAVDTSKTGKETISKLAHTTKWVNHTYGVIEKAKNIEAAAVDMETGMRGYLLAGKEEFLEPYNGGKSRFSKLTDSLKQTVSDNPAQVKLLEEIETNISEWNKVITEPAIQLRRNVLSGSKKISDVVELVGQGRGKKYFDKFRGQIATFIEREEKLMEVRKKEAGDMSSKTAENLTLLDKTNKWVDHTHVVIQKAMEIEAAAVDMETGMRGYLLAGKEEFLEPYNAGSAKFAQLIGNLQKTVSDNPPQVALLGETKQTIDDWVANVVTQNIDLRRSIGDAKTMNDMAKLVGEARGKKYFDKFRGQIKTFIDREAVLMKKRQAKAETTTETTEKTIVFGTTFTVVFSILLFSILTVSITKPVKAIAKSIKDIAEGEGDLTKRLDVSSKDEIGEVGNWFNTFVDKLQGIIGEVKDSSQSLACQTKTVANNSNSISQSVANMNNQAVEVSGAAKSMYDNIVGVTADVQAMNDNTGKVSSFSEEITDTMNLVATAVEESQISVSTIADDSVAMSNQINKIVEQTDEGEILSKEAVTIVNSANEKIEKLAEASEEIANVIDIIIEISEQTKNLALNATIEAARAGEAGKGFAVVANEVKELAKQTNDATTQIQSRIDAINNSTHASVTEIKEVGSTIFKLNEIVSTISNEMGRQQEKVNNSSVATTQAADVLKEIAQNISEVSQGVNQINSEMTSLAQASENISESMKSNQSQTSTVSDNIADMHKSLESNSSEISHISTTANEMANRATDLQKLVDRFIV